MALQAVDLGKVRFVERWLAAGFDHYWGSKTQFWILGWVVRLNLRQAGKQRIVGEDLVGGSRRIFAGVCVCVRHVQEADFKPHIVRFDGEQLEGYRPRRT